MIGARAKRESRPRALALLPRPLLERGESGGELAALLERASVTAAAAVMLSARAELVAALEANAAVGEIGDDAP